MISNEANHQIKIKIYDEGFDSDAAGGHCAAAEPLASRIEKNGKVSKESESKSEKLMLPTPHNREIVTTGKTLSRYFRN